MMKSKKGLSESLLMTLLIGGNVIWGGTAVHAEEPQKFVLDEYVVTANKTELIKKRSPAKCGSNYERGYRKQRCD